MLSAKWRPFCLGLNFFKISNLDIGMEIIDSRLQLYLPGASQLYTAVYKNHRQVRSSITNERLFGTVYRHINILKSATVCKCIQILY